MQCNITVALALILYIAPTLAPIIAPTQALVKVAATVYELGI